jgi:hypothetical protein
MMYIKIDFFSFFFPSYDQFIVQYALWIHINGKAIVYNTDCWNWNKNRTMKLVFSRLGIEIGIVKKK